jgi:hypothetical protein
MERSEQLNELATALNQAQAEFASVPKDSVNPFFKSKYAALPEVVKTAGPVLGAHGLSVSQFVGREGGNDTLTTVLLHASGQFISSTMRLHLAKMDAQGQGSAITYARRYSYMAVLGLVADDDDDGAAASGTQSPRQSPVFQQAKATVAAAKQPPANNTPVGTGEKVKVGAATLQVWQYAQEINERQAEPNSMLPSIIEQAQKWPVSGKQIGACNAVAKRILAANGENIEDVEKKVAHAISLVKDTFGVIDEPDGYEPF